MICTISSITIRTTTNRISTVAPLQLILRRNLSSTNTHHTSIRVPGPIVSVSWLKQHYPQVKVVDATLTMPNEKPDALTLYKKQRLPGAVFFDIEKSSNHEGRNANLSHMLPTKEQFAEYMSSLGLTRDDAIVLYDAKGVFSAPRVCLTMNRYGAKNVTMLDGGIKEWIAAGEPTESGEPTAPKPAKFEALDATSDFVRDMDDVRKNSESASPSFQLLDARSQGRFNGTDPEPRPEMSSGHVPGSLSVPFMALLNTKPSGGTSMKSPEEIKKVLKDRNVDINSKQPLVASCGSGVTACVVLLGLELAGRKGPVGLYDGSWSEWASHKENKIVNSNKKN